VKYIHILLWSDQSPYWKTTVLGQKPLFLGQRPLIRTIPYILIYRIYRFIIELLFCKIIAPTRIIIKFSIMSSDCRALPYRYFIQLYVVLTLTFHTVPMFISTSFIFICTKCLPFESFSIYFERNELKMRVQHFERTGALGVGRRGWGLSEFSEYAIERAKKDQGEGTLEKKNE